VQKGGRQPQDFAENRAFVYPSKEVPTLKVTLWPKPLILLGFVTLRGLPKTARSGYNNPYFFSVHE